MSQLSVLFAVACLLVPIHLQAQLIDVELGTAVLDGGEYPVRARVGDVFVFQAEGPRVVSDMALRYQWFVVQDSSLGVTFRKGSGFKSTSAGTYFDGDIDVTANVVIHAVEFGVITFNVWNEYTGTWFLTAMREERQGSKFDLNPRKRPCRFTENSPTGYICYNLYKHFTSIIYVSRVRYWNGAIVVADPAAALEAAKLFSNDVTIQELEPEQPLIPLVPDDLNQT